MVVEKVALPEATVPEPRGVVPSRKLTMPVGLPVLPAAGVMEAVKVMLPPVVMEAADAVSAVVVAVAAVPVTLTVMVEEMLPRKVVEPPKPAVMLCEPVARAVVVKVALPVVSTVAEPMVRSPSAKRILPLGVPVLPEAGATVAVKVTLEPWLIEVAEAVRAVVVLDCVTMVGVVA